MFQPSLDDTQPTNPVVIPKRHNWIFAGVIGLLLIIIVVIGFFLLSPKEVVTHIPPKTITLWIDGQDYQITTYAEKVVDMLTEYNVIIEAADVLDPGITTPLEDGMDVRIKKAHVITITIDGITSVVRSSIENPTELLRMAGQPVQPADKVIVDGTEISADELEAWPLPIQHITIQKAVTVQIIEGDSSREFNTTGYTVGDVLYEAGIDLFVADNITPNVSTPVTNGMQIIIDRSRPVTIMVDGDQIEARVNGPTVADALGETGIILSGLDYAVPDETSEILPGISVRVIRVTEELITEQDIIPYQTTYQADPNLNLDVRTVLQAGQNGVQQRTIRVRYENGIEVSRITEEDVLISSVQDEIVAYGTNVVIRTIDTPEGPLQYWRKLRVYATSYYPAELGGSTTTSIGMELKKGIIGIDPTIIPYRTNLYVKGYGTGIAADTGIRTFSYWVDLGYSDEDWVSWSSWVNVYLLVPVPETINYLLPIEENGGPVP